MSTWRQYAKEECSRKCNEKKEELKKIHRKYWDMNQEINILEKQISCVHEMEHSASAGALGGFDIDKCTKCGYEYVY